MHVANVVYVHTPISHLIFRTNVLLPLLCQQLDNLLMAIHSCQVQGCAPLVIDHGLAAAPS